MKGLLLRWLVLSVAIMVAAYVFPGIQVNGFGAALGAALVLGILGQHLAIADDGIQWRPQLVTHGGQELALLAGPQHRLIALLLTQVDLLEHGVEAVAQGSDLVHVGLGTGEVAQARRHAAGALLAEAGWTDTDTSK